MKKNYFLIIVFLLITTPYSFSQCSCTATSFGTIDVAGWGIGASASQGNVYAGERVTINNTLPYGWYRISSCGASYDSQLTIYSTSCGPVIGYNDDNGPACGGTTASVDIMSPGGNLFAVLNQYNCATNSTNTTITVTYLGAGESEGASLPSPIAASNCSNGETRVGSGAYRDISVTAGKYYDFTWTNGGANMNGFAVVPQNGDRSTFTSNQTAWYSGTTTTLRLYGVRTASTSAWVATSGIMTYRNTQPSAVSMSAATVICSGGSTNVTASGGTYGTMYWQGTTASGRSTATASSSQSVSTSGTYYFASNNNGCWTDPSSGSTITVRGAFNGGTLASSAQTICYNTSPGNITYSSAPSGGSSLQYQWYRQTGTIAAPSGAFSIGSWTAVGTQTASSTLSGATIGNLTATTSFACRVIDVGSPACFDNWAGNVHVVTVRALFNPGSILTTGETICNGGTSTVIGNNALATGGDASYTYSWRSSADGYTAAISGATSSTYTPPTGLTTTTSYRRYARDGTCNTTPVVSTGTWTVTVQGAFGGGTLSSSSQTICYNTQPTNITYSSSPSGGSSLQYQWYRQTGSIAAPSGSFSIGSWTAVGSQTASSTLNGATIGNLTATTSFACRVVDVGSPACFDRWAGNVHVVTVRSQFTPGSILTTGQTICNGGTPTVIGNNVSASGGDETITYSWRSSADSYAAAIGGATSSTYTPPTGLTTTTSYRRYAKDGTCNTTPEVSTGTWTVTVQSVPTAGSIGTAQTICNGSTPSGLTSVSAGSGDGAISYQWQSAVSPFSSYGNISGQTSDTYSPGSLTATNRYQRYTVSTLNGVACNSSPTSAIEITVQSAVTAGSISANQTICYNTTPTSIASVAGTGSGTITYRWDVSTTSAVAGFSDLGNSAATYAPGALTQDTWYRRYTISTQNSVACESAATAVILKKVQTVPTAGTIAADRTICNNTTTTISSSTAGNGRSGSTITYRWESSTTSAVSGFTSTGVTTASITTGALTVDTWYRRVTIANLDGTLCESSPTTATKVTVQSVPTAGVIEANQTICNGTSPATITSNTDGTGNGSITYRWEKSTTSAVAGYSAESGSSASLSPGNLSATTWYRRYTISTLNSNACESSVATTAIQITVQSVPTAGTIAADQTICYNTTPATISSGSAGTGDGTISYRWQSSTTSAVAGFSDNGTVTASFSPGALTQDTWYKRYTVSTLNGVACESAETSVIKITVQATPGAGSIGSDQTICYNTAPSGLTSSSNGTGTGTISYVWEISTTNASSGFSTIGGATTSTYSPSALTTTSWYRRSTLSTLNGNACTSTTTSAVQITVRPNFTPGSILTTGETICSNNNPVQIDNNVAASGGDNSITYEWRSNGTPIGSTNASSYDPPATSTTTTFTRWAKDATCNTTFEQSTGSWVVTVNNPSVTTSLSNNDFVWTGLTSSGWATTSNWLQWNSGTSSYSVPSSYPNASTVNVILPATSACVLNNAVTNGNTIAVNNLTIEASHTFGLNSGSASLSIAGTLTVNGTWSTPSSGSTVVFNGSGAQTIPVLAYSNLSTATGGTKTLAGNLTVSRVLTIGASSTLDLSTYTLTLPSNVGTPLVNSGTFTASTGKVVFSGSGTQSLAGLAYYDLTISGTGTKTLLGTTSVGNTLALNAGTLTIGANTFTMNGSTLTRTSGSIDASNSSATLVFNNASALILPSSIFSADVNNLTLSNAKVKASSDFTVNGTLYLNHANPSATDGLLDLVQSYGSYANTSSSNSTDANNDLNSVILTLGANATTDGVGDVTGKIKRTSLSDGLTYTFGNKNMRITLDQNGGTLPSSLMVVATKGTEGLHVDKDGTSDFTSGSPDTLIGGAAVTRLHQILRTGGSDEVKFTVRFPYEDSELNGNTEANLVAWDHHLPFDAITPQEHGKSANNTSENWVELADHDLHNLPVEADASFTKYWMLSQKVANDTLWLGSSISSAATDWSNKSNWSAGALPSNWTNVVVDPNVYTSELTITGTQQVKSFEIRENGIVNGGTGILTLNGSGQSWINNGTFNPGTSQVIFNGSDADLIGTTEFYDVTVNNGKSLTILENSTTSIAGTLTNLGTLDATTNENTIIYTGDYQYVSQPNGTTPGYYHLTIDVNSDEVYAQEPLTTKGDLTILNGAFLMEGNALEIKGDLINNANLNGAPTVTMSGTSNQLIGGSSVTSFNDLILSGTDTVTVQNDMVINGILTVESTKVLAGGNSNFEFYGSGIPFVLDGTFVPQTSTVKYLATNPTNLTATTYYDLSLAGGITKTLVGNVNVTNNLEIDSDVLDIDTYSLSIAGTASVPNGGTVDAANGEIIFANDNATINLPNGFFAGNVKDMRLAGTENVALNDNLTITGTLDLAEGDLLLGSNTLVMESNSTWTNTTGLLNAQTGSVLFKSASLDPSVLTTATLSNLEFSRAGVIEVTGDVEVSGQLKLTEGTVDVNNHTLKLSGDMIYVAGGIDADNGKVDFNNTTEWNLPSTFFVGDIKDLQVSGAGGVELAANAKVTNELNMNGGNITLAPTKTLEVGSSATTVGSIVWNNGTVVGPLKRWFAAATNSSQASGIFPVGTAALNRYAQVNFTQAPDGGYLVIEFKDGMPTGANYDTDLPIAYTNDQGTTSYIQNADQSGYWEMTPYNAAGEPYEALDNFNYNLALRINNPTSVQEGDVLNNPPGVKLIRAKGYADGSHGDWELAGTYNTFEEITPTMDYVIKSINVQGFSWFNGGGDNQNPLPVELISFNGLCEENQTKLTWQTASEFHSSYYLIEKSTDGNNWRIINNQPAAGNSTELLSYEFIEQNANEENAYYRLTQVDENGDENVYDPILISCSENEEFIKTFPNPSDNSFQVLVSDKNLVGKATMEIVDTKGVIVNSKDITILEGINMLIINQNLESGVYYINITSGQNSSKVVKHLIK